MKPLVRRFVKTGVLAATVASSLVFAMPGGAVTGGITVSPAPSWSAYIVITRGTTTSVCSGALVGPSWVLTAAHCVAKTTSNPCAFSPRYPAKSFTVYLDRTSKAHKGTAYKVSSVSVNSPSAASADGQCVLKNDVALLHLTTPTTRTPLWIAPSQSAVANNTNAVLYGYGSGTLSRTGAADWTVNTQCNLASVIDATCLGSQPSGASAGTVGDSGGPWTMAVDGNLVEEIVFTGYDKAQGIAYGTSVAQASTGAWLHSTLGIPTVAPGNIVRDPASGNSWLIDPQGYRRPIPDAATLSCLTGQGAQVVDAAAEAIQLMAPRTSVVTCGVGNNVLIAGAGDGGWTNPNDSLAALFTSAGYAVTKSATLPSDLSSFGQVWWIDTNPPTAAEQNQLVAFEEAGGGVFLTGEHDSAGPGTCCGALNSADTSMINSMVVGGGVTAGGQGNLCACTVAMPVDPGVVAGLSQSPLAVSTWTPSQPGGLAGVPASSVFAYYQPGDISTRHTVAAAWDRPSLVGHGRLAVFMDINWTESGYRGTNWSAVAQNVAFFLSGLNNPPGPVVP